MNAKRYSFYIILVGLALPAWAVDDASRLVRQANERYRNGEYDQAITAYEEVLVNDPEANVPRFNQANCYYRLDDLSQAAELFKQVAAESRDMDLVTKAKYNLGNTLFQQGLKQTDSDLKGAIADVNDAIRQWQSTLDLQPEHAHAPRNIEVARLIVKDLLDQLKNQQQQDPNQAQQQNQQQQQDQQNQQQQDQQAQQDPNQPQDPNQSQQPDPNQVQEQDPNDGQQQQPQDLQEPEKPEQDMTAQAILDREKQQKEEREKRMQMNRTPVIKDW